MKPLYYHLLNSMLAGTLVLLGSMTTVFMGDPSARQILIGLVLALITASTIFISKFNDWFKNQDPDCQTTPKLLNIL